MRPLCWLRGMYREMAEVLLRSLALEARTGAERSLVWEKDDFFTSVFSSLVFQTKETPNEQM